MRGTICDRCLRQAGRAPLRGAFLSIFGKTKQGAGQ